jgi:hypothetical protein
MSVDTRRDRMPRLLRSKGSTARSEGNPLRPDAPHLVRRTVVDFSSLTLPEDVRLALAEAFWGHFGVQSERSIHANWFHVKTFDRFARETRGVERLADLNRDLLLRYIEWLNGQCGPDGQPWTKSSRSYAYGALRTMLQWLEGCRPGTIASIEYPFDPFPFRNRDRTPLSKLPPRELRALLKACEADIAQIRAAREAGAAQQRSSTDDTPQTLGGLLRYIDQHFGGILPIARERRPHEAVRIALARFGGIKQVEPLLYPRAESLLPYYLAILIHTAGNPEAIADLRRDCLQPLPLLDDRQALVWFKPRAGSFQRRTFSVTHVFDPPALVRDILQWNERLRARAPVAQQDRLLLYNGRVGVTALTSGMVKHMLKAFCERRGLRRFSLVCIRPSILSSFYRATGDLRRAKSVANHRNLATTVRYVEGPEVQAQHRERVATLQTAFVGHFVERTVAVSAGRRAPTATASALRPAGKVVAMFGFDCLDPFAGVAPGTRPGELCTHYMGCFTCPNAIIPQDPPTLARLLQARDHLHGAAATLHPARWEVVYAPQLRILEEYILPRFSAQEIAAAMPLVARLPPLPDLR